MNKKILKNSNKSFGILFFVIFIIYSFFPLLSGESIRITSLAIAFIFLILGLINSKFLNPMRVAWIKLGEILGKIVSPIVMAFIYFIVITPIGLFMRLIRKDLLKIKFSKANTYWLPREKNIGPMKRQF